jgi:ribulose-phosphate 3-epimerase
LGPRKIEISASILAADFSDLGRAVRDAEDAGADSIHIDYMDGHYVHNLTFGLDLIPALKRHTGLPLLVHLEIANPDDFITDFAQAGADMITVCEDTCPDLGATLGAIRSEGVKAGVSINPDQPLELVEGHWDELDMILLMSVVPGWGGQAFIPSVLPKIAEARRLIDGLDRPIALGVDGGVNRDTVVDVVRAGADTLIMGSAVYSGGNVASNMGHLRDSIASS